VSNAFDYGIGITATDDGASEAIGGIIRQVESLEHSMTSDVFQEGIKGIMGGWDPTALLPTIDVLDDMSTTLRIISEDTGRLAGAIGDISPPPLDEAITEADLLGMEICGVVVCAENATDAMLALASATGDASDGFSEVPKKVKTTAEHMGNVTDAANLLEGSGSRLRHIMTRVNRSMGDTALSADLAAKNVLEMASANEVAWKDVAELQVRLTGAGISMGDLSGNAEENMNTMIQLRETFELSQDEIQRLAGSMKVTGGSITDLAGVAVQFQKDFKVPGLINTLPAAAEAAVEAQSRFGTVVGKSSRDITTNIMRMTGTYSRALGVTAAEAANKARKTFMKFTGEIESFEDLFLGLADDFSPLQTAFLETGMSMEDMEDLMRKGADSPKEFAEEVKRIRDSLDPQMGERFFRQVIRNVDEGTAKMLTAEKAIDNANDVLKEGAGVEPEDPFDTFMGIAKAMRENAVDAKKMKDALVGVREETARLMADEGVRQGLVAYNELLKKENELLLNVYTSVRTNTTAFEGMNKGIAATTFTMVGMNDAWTQFTQVTGIGATLLLGAVSGIALVSRAGKALTKTFGKLYTKAIQPLWRSLGGFRGLLDKIIKGPFRLLGRVIGAIKHPIVAIRGAIASVRTSAAALGRIAGGVLGKVMIPIGLVIGGFNGILEAVGRIRAVISDPSKTGWDVFKGIVGGVFAGIWEFMDTLFLGLPSYLSGIFGAKGSIADSVNEIGVWFGEWLQSIWEPVDAHLIQPIGKGIGTAVSKIGEFFSWLGGHATVFGEAFMLGVGKITDWLTETFHNATAEMAEAYKQVVAIMGLDDEAERLKELEEQTAAGRAGAESDLAKERAAGGKPSAVDIKASDLIRGDIAGGGTDDLEFLMKERMASMTEAQRAMQDRAIEVAAKNNFVGASAELIEAAALKKAFEVQQALQAGGKELSIEIAKRVMQGGAVVTEGVEKAVKASAEELELKKTRHAAGLDRVVNETEKPKTDQGDTGIKTTEAPPAKEAGEVADAEEPAGAPTTGATPAPPQAPPATATPASVSSAATPAPAGTTPGMAAAMAGGAAAGFNPNINFHLAVAPGVNSAVAGLFEWFGVHAPDQGSQGY
jgi:hypothetical protein